ncbi:sigma-54 interaction domain-containing protein [Desulfotomaculum sp. 1211_IL3151]|uniref:sigma-54 interaction domain-containing protein n=1 Tax=Desulfotomaculum sp. 1211_IL3151 TaxID=3084055 RepID=UPI002FD8B993
MSKQPDKAHKIEDFFDSVLDIFYDGIYITDANGQTIKVNSMYEKLTGLKKEDLLGRLVTDLENEGVYTSPLNPTIVKTGKPQTSVQVNKEGRRVVVNGYPVFDKEGKVVYVVTYVRDVTVLSQLKEQIASQADLIEKYHQEARYLRKSNFQDSQTIVESPKMKNLMQLLKRIAATDTTVLLLGETGVGKDVFARKIHEYSSRKDQPFFKINCATIPENLIESELFGYDPGAFSGASAKGKPGYFELADKGTLFLDEMGELPLPMQAKLLRVLQDQEVMRVGSTRIKRVDVRFIAATNRNLEEAIKDGSFRSDLYYRLRVAVLDIPPLRERKEEIIPLINYFLDKFNIKYKKHIHFSPSVKNYLLHYKWTGNVREVENLIQGLVVTQEKDILDVTDLPSYFIADDNHKDQLFQPESFNMGDRTLSEMMDSFERELLKRALELHGTISNVAQVLGMDRSTIFRKLKKHALI